MAEITFSFSVVKLEMSDLSQSARARSLMLASASIRRHFGASVPIGADIRSGYEEKESVRISGFLIARPPKQSTLSFRVGDGENS